MRMSARPLGTTLVELMVAATVGTILCASAYAVLLDLRQSVEALGQRESAERLGTETIALLEAVGSHLRYPVVLGDTALHAEMRIGIGVSCQGSIAALTLAPAVSGSLDAMAVLAEPPMAGDRMEFLRPGGDTAVDAWVSVNIAEVGSLTAKAGCDADSPYFAQSETSRPVVRVTPVADAAAMGAGVPVELYRAVRLTLYHAGDHGWVVGMRRCNGSDCSAAQPLIGPVRSPRDGGLRFTRTPSAVTVQVRVPTLDRTFSGVIAAIDPDP